MATDRENVARAVHVARIEFVNVGQKINLSANPRFRVHESAMICYLAVLDGLQLGFHSVFGVDCVCHNCCCFVPGTGPVRRVVSSTTVQRYNNKFNFQNFYFNFFTFFEKSCILPERIPPEPGIFVCVTPKSNSYARSKSPRRLSFRYNRQSLSHKSPSGTTGPRHLCVRVS